MRLEEFRVKKYFVFVRGEAKAGRDGILPVGLDADEIKRVFLNFIQISSNHEMSRQISSPTPAVVTLTVRMS